jgi:flagellar assembly protein FliH
MQRAVRNFDYLDLEQRGTPLSTGVMTDPQLERFGIDTVSDLTVPMVQTGGMRTVGSTMVEDVIFPQLDRPVMIDPSTIDASGAVIVVVDPAVEAARLLEEARTTARSMLAQAKAAIAAEREAAVQRGYDEGHAQGIAAADEEMVGLVQTCEQIGVHVMEERARVLAEGEGEIVELAISIAQRIVGASLELDPELVVDACRGAMRKAFSRGTMQVLAHPGDLELLRAAGPKMAEELGGVEHLDFIEERRLDRGSVIVRTPVGEIDATIKGKSEKIEQALREGIESRRAEQAR